ncbi:MAG: DMT family transporter [Gammaproteobacteria bacterium]
MRQSFAAGLLAGLSAVIVWGMQFPIAKDAFVLVDPFHVTLVRYLLAACVLTPFVLLREGIGVLSFGGKGLLAASMGAMGMSISPLMVFYGISLAGAEHGSVIVALQPSVMALVQWALTGKRPSRFTLICIGVAFLGVVLVVTRGGQGLQGSTGAIAGSVLILLGGLCWIYYNLGSERLKGWSVWRITLLTILPGTACTMVVIAVLTTAGWLETPGVDAFRAAAPDLVFLSMLGVVYGMLAWNFGTRRIGPLNSMLLTNLMPVATFTYRALQGACFTPIEITGAAIVVAALVANNLYLRRQFLQETRTQVKPPPAHDN